jgi:hypothetical protein
MVDWQIWHKNQWKVPTKAFWAPNLWDHNNEQQLVHWANDVWGRIAIKIHLHSWLQWYFWWMQWCGGRGGSCHGAEVLFVAILFYFCCVVPYLVWIWYAFFTLSDATLMYGTVPYGMVLHTDNLIRTIVQRTAVIAQIKGIRYRLRGKNESEDNHTNVVWFSSLFFVEMFLTPKRGLISSESLFRGARKIIQLLYDA